MLTIGLVFIRSASALACGIAFLGWACSDLEAAELKGDLALLDKVIDAYKANWDGVHSWTGDVLVQDIREAEGSQLIWQSEADFFFRAIPRSLRWNWRTSKGEKGKSPALYVESNGLLKDDKLYQVKVGKPSENGSAPKDISLKLPGAMDAGPRSQAFDPFYFIGYRGENLAERFDFFRRRSKDLANNGWHISQDGDLVTLALDTDYLLNRYVIDLSKGGNLVAYEASERKSGRPLGLEAYKWIYKQQNGLWLPQEVSYQHTKYSEPVGDEEVGRVSSSAVRSIRWRSSQINENIPDDTFTLANIGVSEGDAILDEESGNTYEYGFVEPVAIPGVRWKLWLLVANVVVIFGIALLIVRSRSSSRRGNK